MVSFFCPSRCSQLHPCVSTSKALPLLGNPDSDFTKSFSTQNRTWSPVPSAHSEIQKQVQVRSEPFLGHGKEKALREGARVREYH